VTACWPNAGKAPGFRWRVTRAIFFGTYGLTAIAAGFYLATSPIGGILLARFGMLSDEATLQQYNPEDREACAVEDFVNAHPLTTELRANTRLKESRPHLRIPAQFRRHNLTAGTLLGPGRVVVPPNAWVEEGKSLTSISFLGSNLCGHPGIVHGGLLATMLDEGMARCCWDALPRKLAVTAKLEINYVKPVLTGNYVVLRAETVRVEGRKAWVKGRIETLTEPGKEPVLLAEASGLFISPKPRTVLEKVI
jgi:acyl-coenzyme A thioesterase PaaI-like protein